MFGDSVNRGIIPTLCVSICKEAENLETQKNIKTKVKNALFIE